MEATVNEEATVLIKILNMSSGQQDFFGLSDIIISNTSVS